MAKLTPARLRVAESVLDELMQGDDLSPAHRSDFQTAYFAVQKLIGQSITARPEDHQPVSPAVGVIGCSCGMTPPRTRSLKQIMTPFLSHLGKLGLPRNHGLDPLITYGPQSGKRWSEAYR